MQIGGVTYGHSDEAIGTYKRIRSKLRYRNIYVASAISGTTALHDIDVKEYPANAASIEDMTVKVHYLGAWMRDPKQQVVDLSDPMSRRELQQGIERLWTHVHGPVRLVDNAAVHPGVARLQAWKDYCDNIKALRELGERALHINTVFNVFVRPWQLTDVETKQLTDAVAGLGGNGISLPLPWSESIKNDTVANNWAIYRYRQILDRGITVILIPSDDAPRNDLYKWVNTWRRRTDRIYFATPFQEVPPY